MVINLNATSKWLPKHKEYEFHISKSKWRLLNQNGGYLNWASMLTQNGCQNQIRSHFSTPDTLSK